MFSLDEKLVVALLLAVMFLLAFTSSLGDSASMDEVAHIPSGFSYLSQKDARLNPEHPPLLKELAALPLLFLNLNFPSDIPSWSQEINSQWDFGFHFLYQSGNPADLILILARIAPILILVLLGFFIYKAAKEFFDRKTALLALVLYSFSPTFLAHGRLVTTDVASAAGIFIATYYFLRFLKLTNKRNLIFSGIAVGFALLTKFSTILLIPFFGLVTIFWILTKYNFPKIHFIKSDLLNFSKFGFKYFLYLFLIFFIAFLVVGIFYQYHTWNYPPELQIRDINAQIYSSVIKNILTAAAEIPIIRGFSEYFLGLFMVFQRVAGGNTIYFLGEVSNQAWWYYFPVVYLLKIPLAFHLLTLLAILYFFFQILLHSDGRIRIMSALRQTLRYSHAHLFELSAILFLIIYWFVSIRGNLNLGVRHLLPTFPFLYVLIAHALSGFLYRINLKNLIQDFKTSIPRLIVLLLVIWYILSSVSVYPYFLAYFNELAGGPSGGYRYVVDSNLDWGQDLRRLTKWVQERKIEKIKVAYFGGGMPSYYLGDRFEQLQWGKKERGWIAISATLLQGGRGKAREGFDGDTDYFRWLDAYEPETVIGNSIFVYNIESVNSEQ